MQPRYIVGFEEGVTNLYMKENPDMIPVVDMGTQFMEGNMICLCAYSTDAQTVAHALNVMDDLVNIGKKKKIFDDLDLENSFGNQ